MSNVTARDALVQLKGNVSEPAIEIFKVGPEQIEEFISKFLVVMGAEPTDIKIITVTDERKKLRIAAIVDKESVIFDQGSENPSGLTLLGTAPQDLGLSKEAKQVLRDFGYFHKKYDDDCEDGKDVYMCNIQENKKSVEIEFNVEVTLAIITDSDFTDEFFTVDAVQEAVRKKKYNRRKYKGKRRTIVFAHVNRSYQSNGGFSPEQVEWFYSDDDEDEEEDDED